MENNIEDEVRGEIEYREELDRTPFGTETQPEREYKEDYAKRFKKKFGISFEEAVAIYS